MKVLDRKAIALDLLEYCDSIGCASWIKEYAGKAEDKKGKPHVILCGKPGTLDLVLYIYSDKFINVQWAGRNHEGVSRGSEVCRSIENAKKFLKVNFQT